MNKITLFHCADVHLDWKFSSLLKKPGLSALRRQEICEAFLRMIESVKEEKPDFLLICGDLFEHEYVTSKTVNLIIKAFSEISETRVIMIPGNHDMDASNSFYRNVNWNDNVYFLGNDTENIIFDDKKTAFYGIGFGPGFGQSERLNRFEVEQDYFNILLFHGDIDLKIGERDYNSITSSLMVAKKFDYVAAGHIHKRKEDIGGHGIIYNPGSLEPLGFDEPGVHGYFKTELSKNNKPSVVFVENSLTCYQEIKVDVTDIFDDTELLNKILQNNSMKNIMYKFILVGNRSLNYKPDIEYITNRLMEKLKYVSVEDNSRVKVSMEELALLKGLKGAFAKKIIDKLEKTENEEDRNVLERALYYGISAIEENNVTVNFGEDL